MTERWREKLGALGRAEPDEERLRGLASGGPRMPEPGRGPGSRVLTGVVAFAVAASAIGFLALNFTEDPVERVSSDLDPAAICDVPDYDPGVALLVGQPVREVSLGDLEAAGQPASELEGPATDELRAYLASPAAVNAPAQGWRPVEATVTTWSSSHGDEVVFVAPHDPDGWWVVGFTQRSTDGHWGLTEEEIVDQEQTPAQRGEGLGLGWDGDLVVDAGAWNDPLVLVNDRGDEWTDTGDQLWGIPHVFDRTTGAEVGSVLPAAGWRGGPYELAPGASERLPVALGGVLPVLARGRYDVVACVPALGLASPVTGLEVRDAGVVPDVRVLTYSFEGAAAEALGGGVLSVDGGCLALDVVGSTPIFPVWPDGYVVVERGGRQVLIDPVGGEVAALGDDVELSGGFVEPRWMDALVTGGLPVRCRVPGDGESYFFTSGLAGNSDETG